MDLFTRCPSCETTYRVTTQQLQASGGQVRCGHCQKIFDAFATLTAQEPLPAPQDPVIPPTQLDEIANNEQDLRPGFSAAPVSQKGKPAPARPDPAATLYEWEFKMPGPPRRTALWTILAFVMVMGLVAQAAYVFRTETMVLLPQTRSYYALICESIGCAIGLPKLSNYLHIEASDLKVVDPSHPNEIQLLLSVRNRAPVDLAYPAFELTLTNPMEQAVARRIFLPAEYLPPAMQTGGLKAGTELPLQLYLDTGAVRAAGYRLYLFYP